MLFYNDIIVKELNGVIEIVGKSTFNGKIKTVIGKYLYYLVGPQLNTYDLDEMNIIRTQEYSEDSNINLISDEWLHDNLVLMDDEIIHYMKHFIHKYNAISLDLISKQYADDLSWIGVYNKQIYTLGYDWDNKNQRLFKFNKEIGNPIEILRIRSEGGYLSNFNFTDDILFFSSEDNIYIFNLVTEELTTELIRN